jgi:hypothetical protein
MSKIGIIKPFPVPSSQTGDIPIALASGGTYTPASGNYTVVFAGADLRIQLMDPIALQWRNLSGGLLAGDWFAADGSNIRLINLTGTISLTLGAAGSGGTNGIGVAATGVAVSIAASPLAIPTANATGYAIVGGAVGGPTVTQAGSGFVATPVIMIDPPPPGGIQATAVAALTAGGGIASITMVSAGAGYTTYPNFYILPQPAVYNGSPIAGIAADLVPPPGLVAPAHAPQQSIYFGNISQATGALLTPGALTGSGTVTGLGLLNWGAGYVTTAPAVTITGAGAATATSTLGPAPATESCFLQSRVSA